MTEKKVENERRAMRFQVFICTIGMRCSVTNLTISILYHNTLWIAHTICAAMEYRIEEKAICFCASYQSPAHKQTQAHKSHTHLKFIDRFFLLYSFLLQQIQC